MIVGNGSPGRAATAYYFAAQGTDENNGCTSPSSACRTIAKMNSLTYQAGDSIRFRGGDSFTGCAKLNSVNVPGRGSASTPITVDSYGSGSATLLSNCPGKNALLTIDGVSGVVVQNLILSAGGTETAMGILIQNSIAGGAVDTVTIRNNEISGFNISGPSDFSAEIFVSGFTSSGRCGALKNIQIVDNKLHGARGPTSPDDSGVTGHGCGRNISNVKYSRNEVYHIGGHTPASNGVSGNGIMAVGVDGGELSFNVVHDNGANATTCGGPAGVWAFRSNNVTIRHNEVYRMQPLPAHPGRGACDWAAYDLDAGVTNSVVEYNYSHDNAGPALLAFARETWGPNTFRYNISENDLMTMAGAGGSITLDGSGVSYIYNNTIFRSGSYQGTTPPSCVFFGFSGTVPSGTLIANNLCINSMTDRYSRTRYLDAAHGPDVSAATVVSNLYYNLRGQHRWNWRNVEYSSLAEFQSATGKDAGSIVGSAAVTVGGGTSGICSGSPERAKGPGSCPPEYRLRPGAAAVGAGADLAASPYKLQVGKRDYYGNAIPHGVGTGYNIGADGSAPLRRRARSARRLACGESRQARSRLSKGRLA